MTQTADGVTAATIAPDCRGQNFWRIDPAAREILRRYVPADLYDHVEPHLDRLGELSGGRLDEIASLANEHEPILMPVVPNCFRCLEQVFELRQLDIRVRIIHQSI